MARTKVKNPKTDAFVTYNEPLDTFEPEEDEIGRREVETAEGEQFTIVSKDPYALWEIKNRTNKVPKQLEGLYTSVSEAQRAIDSYVTAKNFKG